MKMTDWLLSDYKVWSILKESAYIARFVGLASEYQMCVFITFYLEGTNFITCLARFCNSPVSTKVRGVKGKKKE
jgi:hypothetical protein